MTYALCVQEERATYITSDGAATRRENVYVRLNVTFRDQMLRQLKGSKLSVFLCLALHANADMEAWPSIATIAAETGYGERIVKCALAELKALNLVTSTDRHLDSGAQTSNKYCLAAFVNQGVQKPIPPGGTPTVPPPGTPTVPPPGYSDCTLSKYIEEDTVEGGDDGAVAPKRRRRTSRKRASDEPTKGERHAAMFSVLADVCKVDAKLQANKGRLNKVAGDLNNNSDYTPEDIRRWFGPGGWWYTHDFRGKQGTPPSPEWVLKHLGEARAYEEKHRKATGGFVDSANGVYKGAG